MYKLSEQCDKDPQYLTVPDAVRHFRIGKNTFYRALDNREIRHYCVGKKKIIPVIEIEKWLRKRSRQAIEQPQKPIIIVNKNDYKKNKPLSMEPDDLGLQELDDQIFLLNNFDSEAGTDSYEPIQVESVCESPDGTVTYSLSRRKSKAA